MGTPTEPPTSGELPPIPAPAHPPPGTVTAHSVDEFVKAMRAHDVIALLDKELG